MIVDLQHPTLGTVREVGIAIKLSETPGTIRSAAPSSGQHTDAVLKDLGYGSSDIDALRTKGVIG
jgi:formyl-CoA transferase/CoA:oxalate CoA-transferase